MSTLISAICVSHSSRFGLLQRSLWSFLRQPYGLAELVILVNEPGYQDAILAFLRDGRLLPDRSPGEESRFERISVHYAPFRRPIEGAQYAAMLSTGELLAAWDDDDQSHPDRFMLQVGQYVKDRLPNLLAESLYQFHETGELFVTNYAQPAGSVADRCAVSSLLLPRKRLPLVVKQTDRRPWTVIAAESLVESGAYRLIAGHPQLLLVGSNGDNWRGEELHRRLASGLPAAAAGAAGAGFRLAGRLHVRQDRGRRLRPGRPGVHKNGRQRVS
jgi:hypothetical protein